MRVPAERASLTSGDAERLAQVYTDHYGELARWIGDRPHVWLDLESLGWEPLCALLEVPVPKVAFPRANRRRRRPRR